jgi:hypothetical protein
MKQLLSLSVTILLLFIDVVTMACDVCEKQQPKLLRGVAHGAGPQSDWDYLVVAGMVLISAVSLFYALKWMITPGEKEKGHIKRSVLLFD